MFKKPRVASDSFNGEQVERMAVVSPSEQEMALHVLIYRWLQFGETEPFPNAAPEGLANAVRRDAEKKWRQSAVTSEEKNGDREAPRVGDFFPWDVVPQEEARDILRSVVESTEGAILAAAARDYLERQAVGRKKIKKWKVDGEQTDRLEAQYDAYVKGLHCGKAQVAASSVYELEAERACLLWEPKLDVDAAAAREAQRQTAKKRRQDPDAQQQNAIECREKNRRQDWSGWAATLENKDKRLQDGFHRTGDSWGDSAFDQLSKVKGKAFVKNMQKCKRSSWRGGGALDQGVNSLVFSDSD